MSVNHLAESFGNQKIDAVILTHLYGRLANIREIRQLCDRQQVPLIEDCAQGHGATLDNQRAGSFGDLSCFSFYPTKNLGIVLGENSMIGAGSVVNVSVPANAIVVGNPCRIVQLAESQLHDNIFMKPWQDKPSIPLTEALDAYLYRFKTFTDRRGSLTVLDLDL